jgi:hypothetical protein
MQQETLAPAGFSGYAALAKLRTVGLRLTSKLAAQLIAETKDVLPTILASAGFTAEIGEIKVLKSHRKLVYVSVQIIEPTGDQPEHLAAYNAARQLGIQLGFWIKDGDFLSTPLMYPTIPGHGLRVK